MRLPLSVLAGVAILAPPVLASAAGPAHVKAVIRLYRDDQDASKVHCRTPPLTSPSQAAQDEVEVVAEKGIQPLDLALTFTGAGGKTSAETVRVANLTPATVKGEFLGSTLTITDKGKVVECKDVPIRLPAAATPAGHGDQPGAPGDALDVSDGALHQGARDYLDAQDPPIRGHRVEGGVHGRPMRSRTFTIYHLPDGTPAFPLPRHINEKDYVNLAVVAPRGSSARFEIFSCDDVPGLRILGDKATATGITAVPDRANTAPPVPEYRVFTYPRTLHCAGTLSYKITVTLPDAATAGAPAPKGAGKVVASQGGSIKIDPVYRLSWGAAVIFDFGRPVDLSLKTRPAMSGTGTEQFVSSTNDYAGVRPIVLLGVHLCGADPLDWTVCDMFSPFIAADPTRITQGFLWGVNFQPYPGFGLVGGMSVFKSAVLDESTSVQPGDKWTGPGDLPQRSVFNTDGLGGFLGVSVTSDVLGKLLSK